MAHMLLYVNGERFVIWRSIMNKSILIIFTVLAIQSQVALGDCREHYKNIVVPNETTEQAKNSNQDVTVLTLTMGTEGFLVAGPVGAFFGAASGMLIGALSNMGKTESEKALDILEAAQNKDYKVRKSSKFIKRFVRQGKFYSIPQFIQIDEKEVRRRVSYVISRASEVDLFCPLIKGSDGNQIRIFATREQIREYVYQQMGISSDMSLRLAHEDESQE